MSAGTDRGVVESSGAEEARLIRPDTMWMPFRPVRRLRETECSIAVFMLRI
jgi:hypothetical protein